MVSGRLVYGAIFSALLFANHGQLRALSMTTAIIQGIPGIILQLAVIPILAKIAFKLMPVEYQKPSNKEMQTNRLLTEAQQMITDKTASCVIIKNNKIIYTATGPGIKPLLELYENNPEILKDGYVVDRIIGKAAAMIAELGGVSRVYGVLMSHAGYSYLNSRGIQAKYGRCVEIIQNRKKDGMCPLERSVFDLDDARAGYLRLKETIAELMKVS